MFATKRDLTLQHSIKCAVNVSDQCTTLTLIVCSYIIHSRNFVLSMVYPMHNKYVRKQISIVRAMSTFISKYLKIPNRPFFLNRFFFHNLFCSVQAARISAFFAIFVEFNAIIWRWEQRQTEEFLICLPSKDVSIFSSAKFKVTVNKIRFCCCLFFLFIFSVHRRRYGTKAVLLVSYTYCVYITLMFLDCVLNIPIVCCSLLILIQTSMHGTTADTHANALFAYTLMAHETYSLQMTFFHLSFPNKCVMLKVVIGAIVIVFVIDKK